MTERRERRNRAQDLGDTVPGFARAEETTILAATVPYAIGLVFAILLTLGSFYMLTTPLLWAPAIPIAILVLGVAQIGVHLVFFLHITTAPDNTNNVLALAFGILIVGLIVVGSLWIMAHLDRNMLPMQQIERMGP